MAASGNNAQDGPDLLTILNNPGNDMVNPCQILGSSDHYEVDGTHKLCDKTVRLLSIKRFI